MIELEKVNAAAERLVTSVPDTMPEEPLRYHQFISEYRGGGTVVMSEDYDKLRAFAKAQKRGLYYCTKAGVIEAAVRNPAIMEYMKHWEGRAESAEKEEYNLRALLDKAEARLRELEKPVETDENDPRNWYFFLNGRQCKWIFFSHFNGKVVSYEDCIEWSGINSDSEVIRERVYTVTYSMLSGSTRRDGSLTKGESVPFENGMIFNVTNTSKA